MSEDLRIRGAFRPLVLNVRGKYFDQIAAGKKHWEFRVIKPYWTKRLYRRSGTRRRFDAVCVKRGYPRADEADKHLYFIWLGFRPQVIVHPHFGPHPVHVYRIDVSVPLTWGDRKVSGVQRPLMAPGQA